MARDDKFQYGNKLHEVVLKDGTKVLGFISYVDYDNEAFFLLQQNQPGMLGRSGTEYKWADCKSVRAEGKEIGLFREDMILAWKRWRNSAKVR